MKHYRIILTFTEPLLGTAPLNQQLYADYIASKAVDVGSADELETIEEMTEKGTTGFHRMDGVPILYDYVLKGFFKDACGMLRRSSDSRSAKLVSYKRVIDGLLFVKPRRISLKINGDVFILERPLRAQTAQGERVALSRSEALPVGSGLQCTVQIIDGISEALLRDWLDYGALRGLGQWRNGGYGSFTYELTAE